MNEWTENDGMRKKTHKTQAYLRRMLLHLVKHIIVYLRTFATLDSNVQLKHSQNI